jgi:hypothetical protein
MTPSRLMNFRSQIYGIENCELRIIRADNAFCALIYKTSWWELTCDVGPLPRSRCYVFGFPRFLRIESPRRRSQRRREGIRLYSDQ